MNTPIHERLALLRGYSDVRKSHAHVAFGQSNEIERLQAELMRLRAALIVRDTRLAMLREEIGACRPGRAA